MIPTTKLLSQIHQEHVAAMTAATQAVKHVIRCGQLLAALKAQSSEWETQLEEAKLSRTTAWRYMRVASDAAKNPAKTKYLLEQGASLVDLYRAFDLVKPVTPGGYKSDVYQRRKLAEQLEMDFSYEEFTPQIRALIKSRNVETLAPSSIQRLLEDVEAAAARLRDLLSNHNALEVP